MLDEHSWQPLLTGHVGSHAYGLSTSDSDHDFMTVAAAPLHRIAGLYPLTDRKQTMVEKEPHDHVTHEVAKFLRLCLQGNPSVNELLWLVTHPVKHYLGDELIGIRRTLLGAVRVREAYLGYAANQFKLLKARGDGTFGSDTRNCTAKHARHLLRLLDTGTHLHRTGQLVVEVADPQRILDFGDLVAASPARGLAEAEKQFHIAGEIFDNTVSPLPGLADPAPARRWLDRVRRWTVDYERTS